MDTMARETVAPSSSHVLISNIPADYHTADLRRFFADFVEGGKFECFHFRHRREQPRHKSVDDGACAVPRNDMYSRATCSRVHRTRTENEDSAKYTTCCIVKMQERLVGKDHNNRSVWGFRSFLVLLILILALNPDPCSFRTPNYMEIVVILFFQ